MEQNMTEGAHLDTHGLALVRGPQHGAQGPNAQRLIADVQVRGVQDKVPWNCNRGPGGVWRECGVWVTVGGTRFGWRDTKPPAKQTQSVETARAPHGPCHPTCISDMTSTQSVLRGSVAWTSRPGGVWSRPKSPRHSQTPHHRNNSPSPAMLFRGSPASQLCLAAHTAPHIHTQSHNGSEPSHAAGDKGLTSHVKRTATQSYAAVGTSSLLLCTHLITTN